MAKKCPSKLELGQKYEHLLVFKPRRGRAYGSTLCLSQDVFELEARPDSDPLFPLKRKTGAKLIALRELVQKQR